MAPQTNQKIGITNMSHLGTMSLETQEDTPTCPLCMEDLDDTDRNFFPCSCDYQVCLWCLNYLKENMEGKCPACRQHYDENKYRYVPTKVVEINSSKRPIKSNKSNINYNSNNNTKDTETTNKKTTSVVIPQHYKNTRVIQRNLVYVLGLPLAISTVEEMSKPQYFSRYGTISNIVITHNQHGSSHATTCSAYITYANEQEAVDAISDIDGASFDGRSLRASFGTTKYCSFFLRGLKCTKNDCFYLHHLGREEDSFSREEIVTSRTHFLGLRPSTTTDNPDTALNSSNINTIYRLQKPSHRGVSLFGTSIPDKYIIKNDIKSEQESMITSSSNKYTNVWSLKKNENDNNEIENSNEFKNIKKDFPDTLSKPSMTDSNLSQSLEKMNETIKKKNINNNNNDSTNINNNNNNNNDSTNINNNNNNNDSTNINNNNNNNNDSININNNNNKLLNKNPDIIKNDNIINENNIEHQVPWNISGTSNILSEIVNISNDNLIKKNTVILNDAYDSPQQYNAQNESSSYMSPKLYPSSLNAVTNQNYEVQRNINETDKACIPPVNLPGSYDHSLSIDQNHYSSGLRKQFSPKYSNVDNRIPSSFSNCQDFDEIKNFFNPVSTDIYQNRDYRDETFLPYNNVGFFENLPQMNMNRNKKNGYTSPFNKHPFRGASRMESFDQQRQKQEETFEVPGLNDIYNRSPINNRDYNMRMSQNNNAFHQSSGTNKYFGYNSHPIPSSENCSTFQQPCTTSQMDSQIRLLEKQARIWEAELNMQIDREINLYKSANNYRATAQLELARVDIVATVLKQRLVKDLATLAQSQVTPYDNSNNYVYQQSQRDLINNVSRNNDHNKYPDMRRGWGGSFSTQQPLSVPDDISEDSGLQMLRYILPNANIKLAIGTQGRKTQQSNNDRSSSSKLDMTHQQSGQFIYNNNINNHMLNPQNDFNICSPSKQNTNNEEFPRMSLSVHQAKYQNHRR